MNMIEQCLGTDLTFSYVIVALAIVGTVSIVVQCVKFLNNKFKK